MPAVHAQAALAGSRWLASLTLGGSRLITAEMPQSLRSLRSLRLVRHLTGGTRPAPSAWCGISPAALAGSLRLVRHLTGGARASAHQPTATSRYCGLLCEMNDDWLATSSYGKPYASRLMAWSCQNLA